MRGIADGVRRGLTNRAGGSRGSGRSGSPGGIQDGATREAKGERGALSSRIRDMIENWFKDNKGPGPIKTKPNPPTIQGARKPDIIRTPIKDPDNGDPPPPPPPSPGSWLRW